MKDELSGKLMIQFAALKPKTYSYLIDGDHGIKKTKRTKNYVKKI